MLVVLFPVLWLCDSLFKGILKIKASDVDNPTKMLLARWPTLFV
jgi:hypothetical protein